MNINIALKKLNELLPLKERQIKLNSKLYNLHQKILYSFALDGKSLDDVDQLSLNELTSNDLIVLDDKNNIVGSYPFSIKKTVHRVFNDSIDLYAMCAFDAISIAPVFNINTNIVSQCHISKEEINIIQNGNEIKNVTPSKNIYVGIRWQSAGVCAAENLCMEMVFLKDREKAMQWKGSEDSFSIFNLKDAIEFSIKYFKPLLDKRS